MRPQYSLRTLVCAVAACALFFAVAIRPPIRLGSVSITIAVGFLFAAVLEAVFRRGEERHFWMGFAILGWGYLLLVFCDAFKVEIGDQRLTSKLLVWLHGGAPSQPTQSILDFERFGQSLITLLIALVGGLASRYYFDKQKPPTDPHKATASYSRQLDRGA
jgi:hypothetical protein